MLTTGSKLFFGVAAAALVAAWIYGLSTGGDPVGVLSAGMKGGVGEHLGYTVLLSLAAVAAVLGGVVAAFRDADADAVAAVAGVEVPPATPPTSASAWPVVAAFGVVLVAIGVVAGSGLFIAGLVAVGIAVVEWMVQAWADRATGDPEYNRTLRNRVMFPIEIPMIALLAVGALALGVSRVFLALPAMGATVVAIVVASVIMLVAIVLAARPRVSANVVAVIIVVGAVALAAGGVIGAAVGPRDFEHHGEEVEGEGGEGHAEPSSSEGGMGDPTATTVVGS